MTKPFLHPSWACFQQLYKWGEPKPCEEGSACPAPGTAMTRKVLGVTVSLLLWVGGRSLGAGTTLHRYEVSVALRADAPVNAKRIFRDLVTCQLPSASSAASASLPMYSDSDAPVHPQEAKH